LQAEEEEVGDFLQLLIAGTATGAIYALAALGFTLLWQASGTINFAQGEFVMVPAFVTLLGLSSGAPLWLAFLAACLASMAVLGLGFKKAVVDPLIRHGVIPLVIATLGLAIGVKNLVKAAYSAEAHPFPNLFPDTLFAVGALKISVYDIGTLLLAGAIVFGLHGSRPAS
jgi:branched-chain amino acid transport system permease protein